MKTAQAVGKPGNGIRFARTGTVLDQIILSRAVDLHICEQLGHDIQLVVSRENHAFRFNLAGLLITINLQMQILLQYLKQPVPAKDVLPEIGSIITIRIVRISLAADPAGTVAPLVEGKEICPGTFEAGGHIYICKIHGKVDQDTLFKCKYSISSGAVELVLGDGICSILTRELALQLHGDNRDAVQEQDDIDAVLILERVMELAGTVEDIGLILDDRRRIETGLRFPENRTELDAAIGKTVAEHVQEGGHFHLPVETFNDFILTVATVNLLISLPLGGLARFDERDECRAIEGEFAVKGEGVAFLVASVSDQIFFDILFEAFFFYVKISQVFILFNELANQTVYRQN